MITLLVIFCIVFYIGFIAVVMSDSDAAEGRTEPPAVMPAEPVVEQVVLPVAGPARPIVEAPRPARRTIARPEPEPAFYERIGGPVDGRLSPHVLDLRELD
jgi:hypothetical protein